MIDNIKVSTRGAELQSLVANGREYLWQGDPAFWGRRSPILFPVVGRLANDTLRIDGHEYTMKQHGFARDAEFASLQLSASFSYLGGWSIIPSDGPIIMGMVNDESIANYPYRFDLKVRYAIFEKTLEVNWDVKNLGDKTMYFQIGAHPAFLLPDYNADENLHGLIRFYDKNGKAISPVLHNYLDDGLRCPYDKPLALNNDEGLLALNDTTFEKDALLIEGSQVKSAALLDKYGHEVLRVSCPQADAFGIWAPNKSGCPFVCIEPWCGIADNVGFKGDISERDCIHSLEPGKNFEFCYSITLNF